MKFPISLSVTSANPDSDLPETKLRFLYVTECHKHFSCLLSFQLVTSSVMAACVLYNFLFFPLYLSSICSISRHEHAYLNVSAGVLEKEQETALTEEKKQTRKGGQPEHEYVGEFQALFLSFIIYLYYFYYCGTQTVSQEPLVPVVFSHTVNSHLKVYFLIVASVCFSEQNFGNLRQL